MLYKIVVRSLPDYVVLTDYISARQNVGIWIFDAFGIYGDGISITITPLS